VSASSACVSAPLEQAMASAAGTTQSPNRGVFITRNVHQSWRVEDAQHPRLRAFRRSASKGRYGLAGAKFGAYRGRDFAGRSAAFVSRSPGDSALAGHGSGPSSAPSPVAQAKQRESAPGQARSEGPSAALCVVTKGAGAALVGGVGSDPGVATADLAD